MATKFTLNMTPELAALWGEVSQKWTGKMGAFIIAAAAEDEQDKTYPLGSSHNDHAAIHEDADYAILSAVSEESRMNYVPDIVMVNEHQPLLPGQVAVLLVFDPDLNPKDATADVARAKKAAQLEVRRAPIPDPVSAPGAA